MRWLFLAALLLTGCSKVAVFEPTKVEKRLDYDKKLGTEVLHSKSHAATLKNKTLITAEDKENIKLEDGYRFISEHNGWRVTLKNKTELKITSPVATTTDLIHDENILTASSDGRIVAITSQSNSHKVVDLISNETLFFSQEKLAITADIKTADPYIDDESVVFATLDGKLLFVDRKSWTKSKELVVGYEQFFNNPIFLGFHEGNFISATANRVVSISKSGVINSLEKEIKRVIKLDSGLYLFALNGEIIRISGRLETLASIKVPFAKVVAAIETNGSIYLVEHSGWIIKIGSDLKNYKVYELPDVASMPLFASKKQLYYGRKIVYWP